MMGFQRVRFWARSRWHKLICQVFREHFQDVLTNALHPEFGWAWDDDGDIDRVIKERAQAAYKEGLQKARSQPCPHCGKNLML